MMDNPIHRERSTDTQVNRTDEELESTELDALIKKYPQYEPNINGFINSNFVDATAKIQYQNTVDGERKKTKVLERIVDDRKKRILDNDRECALKARTDVYCGDKNICEEAIKRYGDEIVATLKCVAVLNAPQSFADHRGEGKLYVTKRAATQQGETPSYRLFYYSYGESPAQVSLEKASDVFGQQLEMMEDGDQGIKVKSGSVVRVSTEDTSQRNAQGIFVSLPLEDLLSVHHRVSDTTEMKKFVSSEARFYKEVDCLACCKAPMECCDKLCSACAACSCKLVMCRMEAKYWEWMLRAGQNLDSLSHLVSGSSFDSNHNVEQLIFNPLNKSELVMPTTTSSEVHWRRYHTINFTYFDRSGDGRKHRCVVVMDPLENTKLGIDMVCRLTSLLQDLPPSFVARTAAMDSRDPLHEHASLLRSNTTVSDLVKDAVFGNIDVHMEVSYFYRVNHVWALLLALIGLCVSFAAAGGNVIFIFNGLYGMVHFLDRIYNFRQKEYNRSTILKDVFYSIFGLLLTAASSAVTKATQSEGASIAFTFFQAFFSFCGSAFQLWNHYQGKTGAAATPMFESGKQLSVADLKA
jgi:hypothetical protein